MATVEGIAGGLLELLGDVILVAKNDDLAFGFALLEVAD